MTARDASLLFDHGFTRIDPERAHRLGFRAVRAARPVLARRRTPGRPVTAMGLTFPNVLGLAAGFDKNAVGIDALGALGFGHVEVGTVTGEPQPGNEKPRLFRLTADRAVVNRMGFNNDGAEVVAARLAARGRRPADPVLGVNIGKTKVVPEDDEARARRLRASRPAARAARRLPGRQRQLAQHAGAAQPAVGREARSRCSSTSAVRRRSRPTAGSRCWSRSPRTSPTRTCWPSPTWPPRSTSTGSSRPTPRSRAPGWPPRRREVEAAGAGGLSGRPLTTRSLEVLRLLRGRVGDAPHPGRGRRHHHRRGRAGPARRRGRPAAGLHGVHLRGAGLAPPDRQGSLQ